MKFYKLGYFFLSKVNNITESLEKRLDKVVSRDEKNFSVHRKYMNFLTPRKTALDEPLYKLSAGRSMVEMLGVLAIIGVLSVGAIAGYSKAMLKYKLNKQAEQLNTVINAVARNTHSFSTDFRGQYITPYFIKMGEIPTEMFTSKNDIYLSDIFNNQWGILYVYDTTTKGESINLAFSSRTLTKKNSDTLEMCRNLLVTAKENASNIAYVSTLSGYQTSDTEDWLVNNYSSVMDLDALEAEGVDVSNVQAAGEVDGVNDVQNEYDEYINEYRNVIIPQLQEEIKQAYAQLTTNNAFVEILRDLAVETAKNEGAKIEAKYEEQLEAAEAAEETPEGEEALEEEVAEDTTPVVDEPEVPQDATPEVEPQLTRDGDEPFDFELLFK